MLTKICLFGNFWSLNMNLDLVFVYRVKIACIVKLSESGSPAFGNSVDVGTNSFPIQIKGPKFTI